MDVLLSQWSPGQRPGKRLGTARQTIPKITNLMKLCRSAAGLAAPVTESALVGIAAVHHASVAVAAGYGAVLQRAESHRRGLDCTPLGPMMPAVAAASMGRGRNKQQHGGQSTEQANRKSPSHSHQTPLLNRK